MSRLLRYPQLSNVYFITCVTHDRQPLLTESFLLLKKAYLGVRRKNHFTLIAWVVLPDHIHLLIDVKDNSISTLMQKMKMSFGMYYRGKMKMSRGSIWQKRFWDHMIRSQEDFNSHMDYIHINPVKHNWASGPFEWPFSSIHEYREKYPADWGVIDLQRFDQDFGE